VIIVIRIDGPQLFGCTVAKPLFNTFEILKGSKQSLKKMLKAPPSRPHSSQRSYTRIAPKQGPENLTGKKKKQREDLQN